MAILFVLVAMAVIAVSMRFARRAPVAEGHVVGVSTYVKVGSMLWGVMATFSVIMALLEEFSWRVFWVSMLFILFVYLPIFLMFRISLILRTNRFSYRQLISYKEYSYSDFVDIYHEKFVFVLKRKGGGQITIPAYLREASSVYGHIYKGIVASAEKPSQRIP